MKVIQYEAPGSIDAAVALLADSEDGRVLAGGTDLLVQMRAGLRRPGLIVDVKKIAEMCSIEQRDGGFIVGAAASGAELGEHAALKAAWPGVVEGMELVGSTQIQGRASLGGNLCNGSPAADSVPALIAGGAIALIAGPSGRREAEVAAVVTGPGQISLANGELVVAFKLPARPAKSSDAYLRFIPRTEMDIAVVGAAVNLTFDDGGTCTDACVVLGAVAPTAVVVPDAAAALIGSKLEDSALEAVAAAASAACNPIDDKRGTVEYRIKVAGVLARRATVIAADRARSN